MKITKTQLKQIIKEELGTIKEFGEEPAHPGAIEETHSDVEAAHEALHLAVIALEELVYSDKPHGELWKKDATVTLVDFDSKVWKINNLFTTLKNSTS